MGVTMQKIQSKEEWELWNRKGTMKKKMPKFFTVGDLKQLLASLNDSLPVGVVGHFGEFLPMNEHNFRKGQGRLIPAGSFYWRDAEDRYTDVLVVETPDIGPEPD